MFDVLQQEDKEDKETRRKLLRLSAIVILALAVIGTIAFFVARPHAAKAPLTAQKSAPAIKETSPNPKHDLEVVRAVMGKDVTGIRVVWSVQLKNNSSTYAYSNVEYEATFLKPDGSVLAVTRGTIPCNLAPGDEQTVPDFFDGMYDARASTYNFVLVGAKAKTE